MATRTHPNRLQPHASQAATTRGAVPMFPGYHPSQVLLCNQREAAAIAGVQYAGRRPTWLSNPNPDC